MTKGVSLSISEFDEMARLYHDGLTMQEVSEKLKTCSASVCKALKMYRVKARPRPGFSEKAIENRNKAREKRWKIEINHDLTPEKAYILGVLGPGDGAIGISRQSHPYVVLSVTDKDFADEFARCFQVAYGVKPTRTFKKVNRGNRQSMYTVENHRWPIFRDILGYNGGNLKTFRHEGEKVPNAMKNTLPEIKAAYLRGFFDSQGSVSNSSIEGSKKNPEVLKEIQHLLWNLGISTLFYDYSRATRTCRIYIRGKENMRQYLEKVGFSIKRKQEGLERGVSSSVRPRIFERYFKQAKELRNQGFGYKQIAKILGISCWTVRDWIRSNKLEDCNHQSP